MTRLVETAVVIDANRVSLVLRVLLVLSLMATCAAASGVVAALHGTATTSSLQAYIGVIALAGMVVVSQTTLLVLMDDPDGRRTAGATGARGPGRPPRLRAPDAGPGPQRLHVV